MRTPLLRPRTFASSTLSSGRYLGALSTRRICSRNEAPSAFTRSALSARIQDSTSANFGTQTFSLCGQRNPTSFPSSSLGMNLSSKLRLRCRRPIRSHVGSRASETSAFPSWSLGTRNGKDRRRSGNNFLASVGERLLAMTLLCRENHRRARDRKRRNHRQVAGDRRWRKVRRVGLRHRSRRELCGDWLPPQAPT
jgi:hypothetical protein